MVFADLFFIYVFLPLCLICYGLAKKLSTKNIVLIVFSLIFYAWGEPLWILLLLFSSFFNWFIGILIGKFRDTPRAKLAVGGGILVDILLLLIFKYSAFIVENLNAVSGAAIPVPQITLPIGIQLLHVSGYLLHFGLLLGNGRRAAEIPQISFCTCPSSRSSSPARSCGTALWSRRSTTAPSTRPTYAKVRCA